MLRVGELAIDENAILDLADNELIVGPAADSSQALARLTALIASARGSPAGLWQGPGITSSAAMADPLTGLAIRLNADDTVTIRHTLNGDVNLDGSIGGGDYHAIDQGFLTAGEPQYAHGDFNYDRVVDGDDYFLIDSAFLARHSVVAPPTVVPASGDGAARPAEPPGDLVGIFAEGPGIGPGAWTAIDQPVGEVLTRPALAILVAEPDILGPSQPCPLP